MRFKALPARRAAPLCAVLLAAFVGTACHAAPSGQSARSSSAPPSSSASSATPAVSPSSAPSSSSASSQASAFPNPEKDPQYVKAYTFYSGGKYDASVQVCDAAIAANAQCFWAYNVKGIALYFANGNGMAETCLALINKSVAINPAYAYGYFNRALIEKGLKRYDASVADFNRVLALKGRDTWSYYGIATVYADEGNADEAVAYLKIAVGMDPAGVRAQMKDDRSRHFSRLQNDPRFQALENP